jgi:ribosomal protein S18 acetylase RimI-like enzyme
MSQGVLIRRSEAEDLDFLVEKDLEGEGITTPGVDCVETEEGRQAHREKIRAFVSDPVKAGWVAVDDAGGSRLGMILVIFRDHLHEPDTEANRWLFRFLDDSIFPEDGRFCEVFNLWVDPAVRRRGVATRLKLAAEEEARRRGIRMMYTHTEAANLHVIELNLKLGYVVVRVGKLSFTEGDEVLRTSLVKWLK